MNIYSRKVSGLDDIEAEKKKLKEESKALLDLSLTDEITRFTSKQRTTNNYSSRTEDFAPNDETLVEIGAKLLFEWAPTISDGIKSTILKKSKKIATTIGKEIILGYLKWKVIELSFIGIRYLLAKRKSHEND